MKKIVALCIFVCAFVAISAFAQATKPKVVVIPLNSTQKVTAGSSTLVATLTDSITNMMSTTDVSLPVASTCVVTATGNVYGLDAGDTVKGPYFYTARQIGAGTPTNDGQYGAYTIYVADSPSSTGVAATYAWSMTANTTYRFGCAFLQRPPNWSTESGHCRVSWICSAD